MQQQIKEQETQVKVIERRQEIELQVIFLKGDIFFFNQIVVPDKSRSSYMGFAPPSACLLTAADSLLSLFPITAVDGGRSDHRRRQRFCHNCVTNWKKGQRPQVAGGTGSMQQRLQRLCLGMMARFMSVIEQTNGRRTNGRNGGTTNGRTGLYSRLPTTRLWDEGW